MNLRKILGFVIAIIICQVVGLMGAVFTSANIPTWYAALSKPFFSPPNFVFAPVWTLLYALMGISLYLIWEKRQALKEQKVIVLGLFFGQLFLNFLWSAIFFGLRSPLLGFIEILMLWIVLLVTMIKFYPVSKKASLLLVPYLLWVSFASILNFAIFILN